MRGTGRHSGPRRCVAQDRRYAMGPGVQRKSSSCTSRLPGGKPFHPPFESGTTMHGDSGLLVQWPRWGRRVTTGSLEAAGRRRGTAGSLRITNQDRYVGVAQMGGHGTFSEPPTSVNVTNGTDDRISGKLPGCRPISSRWRHHGCRPAATTPRRRPEGRRSSRARPPARRATAAPSSPTPMPACIRSATPWANRRPLA